LRGGQALAQLDGPRPQLVLPGSHNAYEAELRALASERGVQSSVHFPDWLSNDDLEDLYGLARCFVLASLQEGFGLPMLEAMARGVPVACSDIPVLREVAADAALLFDPRDAASIAAAIRRLLDDDDLAGRLRAAGTARCAAFTWDRTAQATLASYRRALAQS
jgi:glycosyltransferase involved in cell wall biosynthesis